VIARLLVANRGEIAVRVIRTARRLGIQTIAVYSDADAHARHVADADQALRIGLPPAAQSYLNVDAILTAARESRADAVHPGYGFLSENPDFAEAVIAAGLTWVGPPPWAMRALGDKAHAKTLAEQHGVPVLAGYHGDDQSLATLRAHAHRINYPVLIKAAAGGGGRGMRVVESEAALEHELEAAKREAVAAFGDDRVLLERFIRRPRHVEVQIFGDSFGNVIHLGERECSIQRRHQKLIEESPSPAVDATLRSRMGDAGVRLARAAGYTNAGTVEFLLMPEGEFAFLEVNARLQVEHPVTEAVTGMDLVELQLRIASGEPLTFSDVEMHGHAIEVRVVAEDPLGGWVPSSGHLDRVEFPAVVRTDTWIEDGATVSPYYDSLLAKVIAHSSSRAQAIETLASALAATHIDGVADDIDVLLATIEHPDFRSGTLHTGFLDEHSIVESTATLPLEVLAVVAAQREPPTADPWHTASGWRLASNDQPVEWLRAGRRHIARASLDPTSGELEVTCDGNTVRGRPSLAVERGAWRSVVHAGRTYRLRRPPPLSIDRAAHAGGAAGRLSAPMPARVVKIAVTPGDAVTQNQPLVVLEAMKMEHVVEAPHAGVVKEICVSIGEQVQSGAQLIVLD
jgi:3-methylcrotonyl-CoA carboxylase alpha subunit